jgi:ubiquinone/menaquinone biosynthesis C-methylase UbiE
VTDSVESDYYTFMHFDADNARRVLRFYTQFFPSGPVLELACGPGVFLSLLREDDVPASGVDIDDGMVRTAREAGHEVVLDDAVAHLKSLPDRSLRGLFCAHFLEHLPAPTVQTVYDEAYRVLDVGGMFVAAVPNAACLSVLGYDFWRDPTHVRFYDPLALQFFARQAGFTIAASGGNPFNHPGPPPDLVAGPIEKVSSLREAAHDAVQRAIGFYPQDPPVYDGDVSEGQLWSELGNVLAGFDERMQTLQHDLYGMHRAYGSLLRQLYPANEVYVAAAVPDGPTDAELDVEPPIEAVVEGTA